MASGGETLLQEMAPGGGEAFLQAARRWQMTPEALSGSFALDWHKRVLPNGLTVIVHPDPLTAMVHVELGYRAGAMDEPAGQTGLSHLFEHLMFTGTERFPGNYSARMLEAGAVMVNALTSHDMTRYMQTAPAIMLDFILAAEADRMENFVPALDAAKLEQQRRVVLEEKRETEGKPLGKTNLWLAEGLLRPGHSRRHPVIGYYGDVEALTLEQAKAWGASRYVPANAVLVIAGGVDAEAAFTAATRHFGAIAPGAPSFRLSTCFESAPRSRARVSAAIDSAAIGYAAWTTPPVCDAPRDHVALVLLAQLLGGDKASPLHRYFVDQAEVAANLGVAVREGRGCGEFIVHMGYRSAPDGDPGDAVLSQLAPLLAQGGDSERLESIRVRELAQRSAGLTTIERRAAALLDGEIMHGDPAWSAQEARLLAEIGVEEIWETGRKWLGNPCFSLLVEQTQALSAAPVTEPQAITVPDFSALRPKVPEWEEARLANGARVRLCRRPGDMQFVMRVAAIDSGVLAEPEGMEGLATLAASALFTGAGPDDAAALDGRIARAGLTARVSAQIDSLRIDVHGAPLAFAAAAALVADAVLVPRFESDEFARRRSSLAAMARAQDGSARKRATRTQFAALLGKDHRMARSVPFGAGMETNISAAQVARFHCQAFDPARTVVFIAGDLVLDEVVKTLEKALAGWCTAQEGPVMPLTPVVSPRGEVHFFDLPGAESAELGARWLIPHYRDEDEAAVSACLHILCGDFRSRANQLLREERGWSYGVHGSSFRLHATAGPMIGSIDTAVGAPYAGEAMRALAEMTGGMRGAVPPSGAEIDSFRRSELLRLARLSETPFSAIDVMESLYREGKGPESFARYREEVLALDAAKVMAAAQSALPEPEQLIWTVCGDPARARQMVLDAGFDFVSSGLPDG